MPVSGHAVQKDDFLFCCTGCLTVYQILETRQELEGATAHPLFEQALKAGIISNPALLAKAKANSDLEWTRWVFEVENLWCPACAEVIKLILMQEKGIRKCVVDYATDVGVVEFAPIHMSKPMIKARLESLGYGVREFEDGAERKLNKNLLFRLGVSAFCSMNIMMFTYPIYIGYVFNDPTDYGMTLSWLAFIASIPAVTYCAWPILQRFMSSLRIGYLGMEALVVIGVSSAFFLSVYELLLGNPHVYFDSMSMVIALVLAGKIVETKAKASAKNTLLRLSQSIPRRCRTASRQFVKISEIQIGDEFIVLSGEKIPLDGIVVSGEGACDQSVMTGESMPIHKKAGDQLLAGTVLVQGSIVAAATRTSQQTALSRIVEMVAHDLDKNHDIPLVDRIVRWFVPLVMVLALATVWLSGFLAAISVLLIACPCAIGIAAPLAEAQTINQLASLGVIVRNRRVLQWLGRENLYFFDKTGTVTKGELKLMSGLGMLTQSERCILKSLVQQSIHPLCKSVNQEINDEAAVCDRIEESVGRGMRGFYQGSEYLFGSPCFTGIEADGTVFAKDGELIAVLEFEDEIKAEMRELALGIPATILSGDRAPVVEKVARECGFDWVAELSPLQKKEIIDGQKHGKIVAMVGDGINDAPALTAAHVSISVLSASDISIQVSDLLLTTDNMKVIPKMRDLARMGRRIIKQNLFWAFFYNIIGVVLAIAGLLSPLYATLAMITSSIFVIGNVRFIPKKGKHRIIDPVFPS